MQDHHDSDDIQIRDLLFFDRLALYYVLQETPLDVVATAFPVMDPKLAASIFQILDEKQKKLLLYAIEREKRNPHKKEALEGICLIARNLKEKGLIIKRGIYYYGKEKESL